MKVIARKQRTGDPYTFTLTEPHIRVLALLAEEPMSDIEAAVRLGQVPGSQRCRLRDGGLVEETGRNAYGKTWGATDIGRLLLAALKESA